MRAHSLSHSFFHSEVWYCCWQWLNMEYGTIALFRADSKAPICRKGHQPHIKHRNLVFTTESSSVLSSKGSISLWLHQSKTLVYQLILGLESFSTVSREVHLLVRLYNATIRQTLMYKVCIFTQQYVPSVYSSTSSYFWNISPNHLRSGLIGQGDSVGSDPLRNYLIICPFGNLAIWFGEFLSQWEVRWLSDSTAGNCCWRSQLRNTASLQDFLNSLSLSLSLCSQSSVVKGQGGVEEKWHLPQ